MLQITHDARSHLLRLRRERGLDERHVARFVQNGGKVGLTFAPGADAADHDVQASAADPDGAGGEIRVVLTSEIAQRLDGAVIDTREEDGKNVLVIQRPNKANS